MEGAFDGENLMSEISKREFVVGLICGSFLTTDNAYIPAYCILGEHILEFLPSHEKVIEGSVKVCVGSKADCE